MSERLRRHDYNPYQLPFDYSAQPEEPHLHVRTVQENCVVRIAADAADYLLRSVFVPFEHFKQEQLYVLLLDSKNRITHDVMVYKGTVNAISIRTSELFMEAVKVNAPSIILSHCHPSGAPEPSIEDVRTTEVVYQAGQILNIELVDHIIVGRNSWISLRDKGLGFPS